jgi:hypothetical protein
MTNTLRASATILALLLGLTTTAHAEGDAQLEEARAHVQKGQQFYDEDAFEAARAEFQRAYEQSKSYKILYNLALVSTQLNDFATAYRHHERYLRDGGAEVPEPRRAEVLRALERLRPRIALVTIETDPPGAEITIDDRRVGAAPLAAPVMLNPGEHKIGARAAGREPAYRHMSLTAGESRRVALELARVQTETVALPSPSERKTPLWLVWTPAVLLAGGAATLGALTLSEGRKLEAMRAAPLADADALASQATRTKTFALVTDVAAGATLTAALIGLYFTVKGARSEATPTTTTRSRTRPSLAVGPGSVWLTGEL